MRTQHGEPCADERLNPRQSISNPRWRNSDANNGEESLMGLKDLLVYILQQSDLAQHLACRVIGIPTASDGQIMHSHDQSISQCLGYIASFCNLVR